MLTMNIAHTSVARSTAGALALLFVLGLSASISGQSVSGLQNGSKETPLDKAAASAPAPIGSVYKEVKIGTTADEVRDLLGKAKIDDKDGFFYEMDAEVVQIRLDENGKVRLISVTYRDKSPNAPRYSDIFGEEPTDAKADGSIHRLVRYPKAGYWVAYSKTSGNAPIITVTMQKL